MPEFMDHWLARSILLFTVILLATTLGWVIMRKFRGYTDQDVSPSSEMMTKFRELHARGGLSDEEYRTIKTKLASELQVELRDHSRASSS